MGFLSKKKWLGYEDSNLGMTESEPVVLPLDDTPVRKDGLAGVRGFEPRDDRIKICCLTA